MLHTTGPRAQTNRVREAAHVIYRAAATGDITRSNDARARIVSEMDAAHVDAAHGMRRYFDFVFAAHAPHRAVGIAKLLGWHPRTVQSRFWRHGMSMRDTIADALLVRIAAVHERHPSLSDTQLANALHWSAPQAFMIFVRQRTGHRVSEFREDLTFDHQLGRYLARHVSPYLERWAAGDDPLAPLRPQPASLRRARRVA